MLNRNSRPKLTRGCRLRATDGGDVLLMPESMLRMNGPGSEILKRCDGLHSIEQIISELQTVFCVSNVETLGSQVELFLTRLQKKRAIEV